MPSNHPFVHGFVFMEMHKPCCSFFLTFLDRTLRLLMDQTSIETITNSIEDDDVTRLLSRYLQRQPSMDASIAHHQKEKNDWNEDDENQWKDVAQIIKELVVLIDNIGSTERIETIDKDTPDLQVIWKGLRQMMLELNRLTSHQLKYWTRVWMYTNPLMDLESPTRRSVDKATISIPHFLNLRRTMVSALITDSTTTPASYARSNELLTCLPA